jgi:hypothetical protein
LRPPRRQKRGNILYGHRHGGLPKSSNTSSWRGALGAPSF